MQNELFKDLKVVELASVLAGPSVGMFFAELGAEVIKIENPKTGGDVTRGWRLPSESQATPSAYYSSVNLGKKVLFKDASAPNDLDDIYNLLKVADVVLVNFKHGDALKFGLEYNRIKTINPTIIYAELTGFLSQTSRVAYDVVIQAETGWMSMNGNPEDAPLKMPVAMMDVLAAHQLKEGILAALWQREKTRKGAHVTCTLDQAGISGLVNQAANYLLAGEVPKQMGSHHPNIAPYGDTFRCKDGKAIVLAVGSDKQFAKLMNILTEGKPSSDPRFKTNTDRVKNREALGDYLGPLVGNFGRDDLLDILIEQNVPAGAVKSMDEVFETVAGKAMIKSGEIEGHEVRVASGVAFTISS